MHGREGRTDPSVPVEELAADGAMVDVEELDERALHRGAELRYGPVTDADWRPGAPS